MLRTSTRTGFVLVCLAAALGALACSFDPISSQKKYLASGDQYFAQKKYGEAVVQYANAVKKVPTSGEAHYKLAEAFRAAGNMRAAFPEFIRAADLLPANAAVQVTAGNLLVNGGMFEEAKTRARAVLQREPKNVHAMILLGNALAGLKSLTDATEVISRAVELDPERVGVYTNLAVFQMASGDREQAEITFKKAISVDPNSADAQTNLGNYYLTIARYDQAEPVLKRAYELAPGSLRTNQAMAALYVQSRRLPEAERYLKAIAEITKDEPSRFALADYYVAANRSPDAISTLSALASEKGHFASAMTRLSLVEWTLGHRDRADQAIDSVLAKEPRYAPALIVKARLLLASENVDQALERVRSAIEIDPRRAEAHLTLARILQALGKTEDARKAFGETLKLNPDSVAAQIELAELHRVRGELDTAIQFAQRAAEINPESVPARLELIRTLLVRPEDQTRAEKAIRSLLFDRPNSAEAQSALAALLLGRNDWPRARKAFERALELNPNSLEALTGLVAMDIAAKKPRNAADRLDAALAKTPDDAQKLVVAAKVYGLLGDTAKVEALLRRAMKADPSNPDAYSMLGQLLIDQHRVAEARQQFTDVVRLHPHAVTGPIMLGLLAFSEGDYASAAKWWERALEISPRSAAAANNLAWLYSEHDGNLDVALQLALTARSAFPDQSDIADTLGWVYYRKKSTTQAIAVLQPIAEKDANNAAYSYHLGMAYAQAGDDAKARRALEQALRVSKDFDGAATARKTLESLVY